MDETVDVREFESGINALVEKLHFPLGFDGKKMTDEQKRAALIQFINFVIMG